MGRNHDHSGLQTIGRRGHLGDFHAPGEPKGAKTMTLKKFSATRPLTDDEEAEIQRMIASDPDNPELSRSHGFDHLRNCFRLWESRVLNRSPRNDQGPMPLRSGR